MYTWQRYTTSRWHRKRHLHWHKKPPYIYIFLLMYCIDVFLGNRRVCVSFLSVPLVYRYTNGLSFFSVKPASLPFLNHIQRIETLERLFSYIETPISMPILPAPPLKALRVRYTYPSYTYVNRIRIEYDGTPLGIHGILALTR